MRIKTRICDVCGDTIYKHAKHTYTIRKKFWELERIGESLDLCQDCYNQLVAYIEKGYLKAKGDKGRREEQNDADN